MRNSTVAAPRRRTASPRRTAAVQMRSSVPVVAVTWPGARRPVGGRAADLLRDGLGIQGELNKLLVPMILQGTITCSKVYDGVTIAEKLHFPVQWARNIEF